MTNLLFDLDGTLVDSGVGIIGSLKETIGNVLPYIDVDGLDFKIGPPIREILKTALGSVTDSQLTLLESRFRASYDRRGWKLSSLYPGVDKTLSVLLERGISMYVITNKPITPTIQILSMLRLANYFTHVLSRDSRKPYFANKTDMIRFLIAKHKIKCKSAYVVGDSEEDRKAATECGIRFIGIEYGYGTFDRSNGNFCSIRSFPDILTLL